MSLRPRPALLGVLATASFVAGFAPAVAQASTVAVASGDVIFTATPGAANNLTVSTSASNYVLTDPAASVTAGAGCSQVTPNQVTCPTAGISEIRANLDDGNDQLSVAASQNVIANGGAGNDDLNGGPQGDQLNGEAGDDDLNGGGGPDWMDGGADHDTVSYATRTNGVRVDLDGSWDDGEAPTGFMPELDNVQPTVEEVTGGAGNDVFVGTSAPNIFRGGGGDDSIDGLGGDDTLNGDAGSDTIDGGYGTDTIAGGDDVDSIMSRDNGVLDHVGCGTGADGLVADREDIVAGDCESVDVPPLPPTPPAADPPPSVPPTADPPAADPPKADPTPKNTSPTVVTIVQRALSVNAKGAIAVPISCGAEQARDCRGSITISATMPRRKASASRRSGPAKRGTITVGKGKFKVKRGKRALASVKASKSALKKAFGPKVKRVAAKLTVSMRNSDGSTTQLIKPITLSARKP